MEQVSAALRVFRRRLFVLLALLTATPLFILRQTGYFIAPPWLLIGSCILPAAAAAYLLSRPWGELLQLCARMQEGELDARPALRLPSPYEHVAKSLIHLAERLSKTTHHFEEEVARRTRQLERQANQLRALGQVGQQVAAVLEPSELLHFVVRIVRGTFGFDLVAVVQEEGPHLVLAACAVRGEAEPPVGRVFQASEPHIEALAGELRGEGGVSKTPCNLVESVAARSQLVVPVRLAGNRFGAIVVQSTLPAAFDADDLFTVRTIAGQVAVALENARLFEAERALRRLAITEERRRISREIHDTLAQQFMGILMHLRAMQSAEDAEAARMHAVQAETLAKEGLDEARRSVWNLRPERLERQGLEGALQDEAERIKKRTGLNVSVLSVGEVERIGPSVAAGLFRIAQEALHNALRHAQASTVTVCVRAEAGRVEMVIADDGVGFDPAASEQRSRSSGFGLKGMKERAQALGGDLWVESEPGRGTRIVARVPDREVRRN